jgi:hypothetical protein
MHAWCALALGVALSTSGALYGQARAPAAQVSGIDTRVGVQDGPNGEEMNDALRCPGLKPDQTRETFKIRTEQDKLVWARIVWSEICIERQRSDAVARAWAQRLDEFSVQLDAAAGARKLAEMEVWLRRLVGKFRIEGKRFRTPGNMEVRGTADCFGIGDGPGVSCVISAVWKNSDKAASFAIRPQVLLFGLDPGAMEIRVTHVDFVAIKMRGFLLDGAVNLDPESSPEILYAPPDIHRVIVVAPESLRGVSPKPLSRVAIEPDGDVDMKFYVYPQAGNVGITQPVEFDLQLHRELPVGTAKPADTRRDR